MQKLLANNHSSMDAMIPIILFFFIVSFNSFLLSVTAADTIAVNQTLKDGQTIVSAQETFELGFFSPGNTTRNRYLGIWYKRLAAGTVAWVANRETPIANKFGELTLHPDGILVLRDSSTNRTIWASDYFGAIRVPLARLFDNGNLMVANDAEDRLEDYYIWQSFDHPGNTFLPTVRFGRNLERGVVRNVTSWKSVDDPAPGPYMVYMDFNGFPQIFQKNGDVIQFRLGIWNGLGFTGMPSLRSNPIFSVRYVSNEIETFSDFHLNNASVLSRLSLSPLGDMSWWNWINRTQGWFLYLTPTVDNCVRYGLCGVYGSCDIEQSPSCECLKGFTPKRRDQWDVSDWTEGCYREIPLDCVAGDGFRKYSNLKLPDTRRSWFDRKMTLEQCEMKCRNECNCTAYTTLDIKDNIGCLLWYDELIDMRKFPNNGQDIYIRMAAAELEKDRRISRKKTPLQVILIPLAVGITILLGLCVLIIKKMRKQKPKAQETVHYQIEQNDFIDLPLFSLSKLLTATDNFSSSNKLGQGGFGPVYKGVLNDGLEIAVKRLSTNSSQGVEEFKNEVLFISRLQHRNLVRILGCCVEGQERMLIYEYMPNKGLDLFLFDETQSKILDWSQRFQIINGIARGLLYLHQDSRLRIIHRDLKAANILLDRDMNPKISDFGLARSFRGHETETNTRRVVGTYGYMSPEYAGDGIFSVKSDIFSFGVLVLEIVSGKKNRGFFHEDHNHNLLGHAWRLHREGKTLELADPYVVESGQTFEVLLCIHVGLLCVQHHPGDRPNMSTVVMMLSGDGQLPEPKEPGFYTHDDRFGPENSSSIQSQHSNNGLTVTLLDPR